MNGFLHLISNIFAYADQQQSSNPLKKYVDWAVDHLYPVANPKSDPYVVDPSASLSLFNGTRTLLTDGTSEFLLSLSTLAPTRYRLAWDGTGTNPVLRTDRNLALAAHAVTVTVNANMTTTWASNVGDWSAVLVGDTVFVPDTTTGDAASVFNPLNTGYWTVIAKAGNGANVTLSRPVGTGFIGFSQVVTPGTSAFVVAFAAAGVQVGDSLTLSAGFTAPVLGTYQIVAVNSKWVEFFSTVALPSGVAALPGAAGIQIYTRLKRFIRIEADQLCAIQLNGDTGQTQQIAPWVPADVNNMGAYEKSGPVWSATIVNLTSTPANILLISAE